MKKRCYLLVTLLVSTLSLFSSCGEDDDTPGGGHTGGNNNGGGDEPTAEEVKTARVDATAYDQWVYFKFSDQSVVAHPIEPLAGTYTGDIAIVVGGADQGTASDLKMEVNRISEDSLHLVLKDFSFGSYQMGDLTSGAHITLDSLGWQLEGGELTVNHMTVSSKGTIAGKNIEIQMTIQPGAMPMPISATYTGTLEKDGNIDESSFDWDIALHKYDVKTNAGAALATTEKDITKVAVLPADGYVADVQTDSLLYDMSGMMKNAVGYACGHINEILNEGVVVHMENMPPSYTTSDLVYILKLKSGEYAKIKFTDYTNDENVKGHITFEYVYPFK